MLRVCGLASGGALCLHTVSLGNTCLQAAAQLISVSTRLSRNHKDRKSTRLNSSHVEISYAVFCLKKQNPHYCPLWRTPDRAPCGLGGAGESGPSAAQRPVAAATSAGG